MRPDTKKAGQLPGLFAVRAKRLSAVRRASAFQVATIISISRMAKGKPVAMALACSAASPPPSSSAIATSPSKVAQNTRCATGASTLPPAVIVSITSEPESDEVTKNTSTSTMPISEVMPASGSGSSILNSDSSGV